MITFWTAEQLWTWVWMHWRTNIKSESDQDWKNLSHPDRELRDDSLGLNKGQRRPMGIKWSSKREACLVEGWGPITQHLGSCSRRIENSWPWWDNAISCQKIKNKTKKHKKNNKINSNRRRKQKIASSLNYL